MSMNVPQGGGDQEMCDVNTTPLIDVMLVLLVMLIVTLPTQTHLVKLDLPPPNPNQPPDPPPSIYIDIDPDGTIVWNNEPLTGGIPELEEHFKIESPKEPQAQIQLRPSALAQYDVIANVMAAAQRNDMTRMGFTNVAEYAD